MKMKKVSSIILTAAILLTTACSDNNTSSVNSQNSTVGNSSGGVTDNSTNSTVVENTPNKVDDKFPQCEPANQPDADKYDAHIMKGTDGYYYTKYKSVGDNKATMAVYYYDKASGQSIPLCSKPQCMHDGNDFCTATGGGIYRIYESLVTMYNGYIYRLGNNAAETENWSLSLLKMDLQGNELSEVADVFSVPMTDEIQITPQIRSAVFHYGKLFVSVSILRETWENALYIVDLASGEVKEINIAPAENGTKKWGESVCSYITADGDYLYYTIRCCRFDNTTIQSENHMTYNRTVMHRYNIKTGATEVISALPDVYSSFTVADGIIYYTVADRSDNTISLYSYDIANDKTTTLADKLQQNYVDGKYVEQNQKATVVTDKKYLYVCTRGLTGHYAESNADKYKQDDIDFYIYSLDGKELLHGLPGIDMTMDSYAYSLSAVDGELYLNFSDEVYGDEEDLSGMYTIKTEDLINGGTEWTKLYKAIN